MRAGDRNGIFVAARLRATGQLNRLARIRGAGAGEDRRASADAGNGVTQQLIVFGLIQRMRFAGGSGDDESLRASLELKIDQPGEGIEIDRASPKRSGESADASGDALQGVLVAKRRDFKGLAMLLAGTGRGKYSGRMPTGPRTIRTALP